MRQLGLAVANYHSDHGEMPPAYIADEDGKPMHSWRVLILPYLDDEQALYDQYDFDEPWNGPNNRKLADQLTHHPFFCPSDDSLQPSITSYVAVVGERTLWPGAESGAGEDFSEHANIVSIVEVVDSGIHWMEPRDLSFEDAIAAAEGEDRPGLGSRHSGSLIYVGYADTHVSPLSEEEITGEKLTELLTVKRSGGG